MTAVKKTALIIGAGPAGLTAALEFCRRSSIRPIVFEASERVGGISCTIRYNGNRIDIGGHRFFSKSDRVMDWWTSIMPIQQQGDSHVAAISYHNQQRVVHTDPHLAPDVDDDPDAVMLIRPRKSRIYFLRSFFDYPLTLSVGTLRRLGLLRTIQIGFSYLKARLFPRRPEKTLEDFLTNRFGRTLYLTFFKSYTEKVWGVPCEQIDASWGAQRIKGLSLRKVVSHFFAKVFRVRKTDPTDIKQKDSETSLIEQFLYPKYGPGQLWERVAKMVCREGGEVRMGWRIVGLNVARGADGIDRITSVEATNPGGETVTVDGDFCFSTMPVRDLLKNLHTQIPAEISAIANGLVYRDFITVGLLVDRLLLKEKDGSPLKDTWIYIQEPDVLVGRLQIFNNWSPHLVADPSKIWIGLEYFCYETDPLWKMPDAELAAFAIAEVGKIGILRGDEVRDSCVFRVPKTYPAYFGTYDRFDEIVRYVDQFENLYLLGRNGMHKYNNQDHSMLTAMTAVDNILAGKTTKDNLWSINTEQDYHEHKDGEAEPGGVNEPAPDEGVAA
ncbi:protoporphyrinogen oxidase [Terriglobus roseus DSM 18391]|uniref:Protoporphyrinogen oxidase n=1 Tax=Terriglobus roseus (strain DSM 18391 / NRRL B-41598 / KBS 63) TaxID=926566 RepID=I3ZDI5_TERRK|nr:NAD(P)/FAD-dependent oxidoreductase [Terriglobus roseus]AFL87303.1 protoporphyrinogen oxidase [Terriglobus roseus DSM 18391]